jgi:flagellar biosynthesis protein FlhF
MTELKEFLHVLPGAEVHLVLSATTAPKTLRSAAGKFGGIGFHRVILTKLDEAAGFGAILSVLVEMGKPISFLTDGQNVPDDIMPSDPDRLADLVLRANNG